MASGTVNNNLNALMNTVNQTANVSNTQSSMLNKQSEIVKDSFDMVMNRINSQVNNQMNEQFSAVVNSKSMASDVSTDYSRQDTVNKTVEAKEPVKTEEDVAKQTEGEAVENEVSESKEEAVKEAGEELVEEVAKEMDVTTEEVEKAMEALGFDVAALLNPENMKQLLVTLSGNEDPLAIVTDGDLYAHLQNLLETVNESLETLQTELSLSEEDLNALIADMATVDDVAEGAAMAEELLTGQDEVADDVSLEGMKDYSVTVQKDGETVQVKVTVDDASGEQSMKENVTAVSKNDMQQDAKAGERNASGKGEGNAAGNMVMQMPTQQVDITSVTQEQPIMERFVSTEDIMNQIMDYMKINLKGDVQELELQLHPASLGNVNVQIASKDGAITAQFTAQNEIVKAAIESQLVQLKEQFAEQGIKVDAVEVTVANYEFEQSFSGNEKEAGEEQNSGKKNHRRINLSELNLEELPEDMDDSEKIAADMMARSGNTVDYTA
ncbi:MAG: flagellar hook-length control protein FliK [Lachnospiraceae bacterium]|nr:flagellar hook-length control protein FliK [Lachnospiraceae bacterium]